MQLLNRVWQIVRCNVKGLLNQTKDPEKLLKEALDQMQSDLIELRQVVATACTTQKQIERDAAQAKINADEWYKRAQLGLQKGSESLAREALMRRKSYLHAVSQMKEQLRLQKQVIEQLKYKLRQLEERTANAKSKQNLYRVNSLSVDASERLNQLLESLNYGDAIEGLEERVMELEVRSQGLIVLGDEYLQDKDSDSEIDAELDAMKAEMRSRSHLE